MKTPTPEAVLMLGNYHPALAVARSLDRSTFRAIVGSEGSEGATEHSRFVSDVWKHPALDDEQTFLVALLDLLKRRPDIASVIPIAEEFVVFLANHAAELPSSVTIVSPQPEIVRLCRDKTRMNELAARLGLDCSPCVEARSYADALARAEQLGYPVVVRPGNSLVLIANKKAVICRDEASFREQIPAWPDDLDTLLIQCRANGTRHNVYFAARRGELLRHADHETLRTDRLDGTGLTVEGRCHSTPAKLEEATARLVEALGYTGIGLTQFLVDEASGKNIFLELNPRAGGNLAAVEGFGLDLAQSAISLSRGDTLHPLRLSSKPIRYAWTTGDLSGLRAELVRGELGVSAAFGWLRRLLVNAVRADLHATWRWDDPMPTVARYAKRLSITRGLRKLGTRRRKRATGTNPPATSVHSDGT